MGSNHFEFETKRGQRVIIRPLTADDAALLVDIYVHMSLESRYKRFNQALNGVLADRIWQEARQIVEADPQKHFGFIALLKDEVATPLGAVRLAETMPREAEVAISIRDDFQNQGLGTQLMATLAGAARERGYRRLIASIRNDNPAIWQVFKSLPFNVIRLPEGSFSNVVIDLKQPAEAAKWETGRG